MVVGFVVIGVVVLVFFYGYLFWIVFVLVFSFSIYGLLWKKVVVDLLSGLFIEMLMFLFFVFIYWVMFGFVYSDLLSNSMLLNVLLLVVGVVIMVFLLCFMVVVCCIMYLILGFF